MTYDIYAARKKEEERRKKEEAERRRREDSEVFSVSGLPEVDGNFSYSYDSGCSNTSSDSGSCGGDW